MDLKVGVKYTYLEMLKFRDFFAENIVRIRNLTKNKKELSKDDRWLSALAYEFQRIQMDERSQVFRIIPPQWATDRETWNSPWGAVVSGQGSPETAQIFGQLKILLEHYRNKDYKSWSSGTETLKNKIKSSQGAQKSVENVSLEVFYNDLDAFVKGLAFYILSFLLLALSWVAPPRWIVKLSLASLCAGIFVHFIGIVIRIIIMSRPPVTTLYESILFVGLVSTVFSLIYELYRKNTLGLFIGSVLGASLLFVSLGYASDGDSMGMLAAVLNTNFWLATHVVTISIGYGCCFVGGLFGHLYLVKKWFKPELKDSEELKGIYKNMLGVSLFALFFTMFGTILGGIWADQSWGRFWGWDPKENGALLICLWILALLHGRIAGMIKADGYAFGMIITNVVVAIAWFGVNLLNVGLHSYGFTDNIAINLALFCGAEILFGAFFYLMIRRRQKC